MTIELNDAGLTALFFSALTVSLGAVIIYWVYKYYDNRYRPR